MADYYEKGQDLAELKRIYKKKQHPTGLPALDCQANSEEGGEKQESVQAKHLEAGGWTGGGNLGDNLFWANWPYNTHGTYVLKCFGDELDLYLKENNYHLPTTFFFPTL